MNGYTTYEAWNTALWIDQDETLQRLANNWVTIAQESEHPDVDKFPEIYAEIMLKMLERAGSTKTGDGVLWTKENIAEYFTTNI